MRHFSGEFTGVRLLMTDELDAIAGGDGEDTDDVIVEEVVVYATQVGHTYFVPFQYWWTGGGGGTATYSSPEGDDKSSIHVNVNINRALTPAEQQGIDALNTAIQTATIAVNFLDNNERLTMPDGRVVTGAEVKAMWAKADFNINEAGTTYANGTNRSAADWNGGNPEISVSIDVISNYNAFHGAAGMNYFILHELGHMTSAGRSTTSAMYSDGIVTEAEKDVNERYANDIARAIASNGGVSILQNPGHGYSTVDPLSFVP